MSVVIEHSQLGVSTARASFFSHSFLILLALAAGNVTGRRGRSFTTFYNHLLWLDNLPERVPIVFGLRKACWQTR
jgi:hypothetical protein